MRSLGIITHPNINNALLKGYGESLSISFDVDDVIEIQPTIKYLNSIDFAAEMLALDKVKELENKHDARIGQGSFIEQYDLVRQIAMSATSANEKLDTAMTSMSGSFESLLDIKSTKKSQADLIKRLASKGVFIESESIGSLTKEYSQEMLLNNTLPGYIRDWDHQVKSNLDAVSLNY